MKSCKIKHRLSWLRDRQRCTTRCLEGDDLVTNSKHMIRSSREDAIERHAFCALVSISLLISKANNDKVSGCTRIQSILRLWTRSVKFFKRYSFY